jgi:hypothetical protein
MKSSTAKSVGSGWKNRVEKKMEQTSNLLFIVGCVVTLLMIYYGDY